MIPGETIASGTPQVCPDCSVQLVLKVLQSPAGYYIGTRCDCGPYSRESLYFGEEASAERALSSGRYSR